MPKMKTRKSVAKRFKKTATGKLKRQSAGTGHLFSSKTSKQKRRLRAGGLASKADIKRLAIHLPK
ncbi:MAG: 50S ribosomal protein L35 [Verrucomicrobia bacterium]|nr:50S ribosomal protein L35 [Verrucomicrobiota bacterium]